LIRFQTNVAASYSRSVHLYTLRYLMEFIVCIQGSVYICRGWFRNRWTAMMTIDCCIMASASLTLLLAVRRVVPISHGQCFCESFSAEFVVGMALLA